MGEKEGSEGGGDKIFAWWRSELVRKEGKQENEKEKERKNTICSL